MKRVSWLAAALLLASCGSPTPGPDKFTDPTPTPAPSAGPVSGLVLDMKFDTGTETKDFTDPVPPASKAGGRFFTANWKIIDGELRQTLPPTQPSLTFLQYCGPAFNTAFGQAPNEYKVEVDVRAYQDATAAPDDMKGSPVGMLGVIPYYIDPTHYLLLVAWPDEIELWNVDGFAPQETWDASKYRLWNQAISPALRTGDPIRIGAKVNINTKMVEVYFNGEMKEIVPAPSLEAKDHYVCLVSNGNYVGYDNFRLTTYPSASDSAQP